MDNLDKANLAHARAMLESAQDEEEALYWLAEIQIISDSLTR